MLDRKPTEDLKVENIGDKTNKQKKAKRNELWSLFFRKQPTFVLVFKTKKKREKSETSGGKHKNLKKKRFCPCSVAMQAISASRKDCDSLFLLNEEVPCVNVVYIWGDILYMA